ncbi:putative short chain dehydrogenase [uncultured Paludibacter sp.]|uniref:Putative short chain dehydrogenase n=1 Tax=uncultured Paludibacter sp. TaxID=497635 RepID=A0A653AKV9_9BACT|nr:putative short chain dehydrogenase [uncultured Paludibacter sp.]
MKNLASKTVLITGAASGIGKIMARLFLEQGSKVVIWDIDQEKINETIQDLSNLGNISAYKVDVSNIAQVKETADKVKKEVGAVDILINNAGIVIGKYFHEHSTPEIIKTMEINANAPMIITHEFLGDMIKQNSGHICNIASSAGMVANPKMSVYAASKWSVTGWSDSLRLEMKKLKSNVKVTTIMPYYINTGMFDGVKSRIPILKPEHAAQKIVNAIKKDKKMLTIPGYLYHLTRFNQGLFPLTVFDWIANSIFGIYKTMDHFTGRKN